MKPEFLGNEVDKNGNSIQIYKVDRIGMSPVFTFFLRQIADLIDNGYGFPVTSWDDDCSSLYAMQGDKIIGHIVYDTKKKGVLWIVFSATDENYRRLGIYSTLFKYLEQIAKDLNFWVISSHSHINNQDRLKTAEKVGMKPVYYYMAKKL